MKVRFQWGCAPLPPPPWTWTRGLHGPALKPELDLGPFSGKFSYIDSCRTGSYTFSADPGQVCFPFFSSRVGLFVTFSVNSDRIGPNLVFPRPSCNWTSFFPGPNPSWANILLFCKNNSNTIHLFNELFKSLIWFNKLQINIFLNIRFFFVVL